MSMDSLWTNSRSPAPSQDATKFPETGGIDRRIELSPAGARLPQKAQARTRACSGNRTSAAPAERGGRPEPSILCIEDDSATAALLEDGLSHLGYTIELAPDGEVGLAKILANRPDLIICDLHMPRMDGLELLEELSSSGNATSPFIFLTGGYNRDTELAGRRLGADDYLTKPVDFEILSAVIENRLRRGRGRASMPAQTHLTIRESEVLTWVGQGKTSAEIAIILGRSERTINFHCDQAMRRLDVVNRTQAVVKALSQGLIAM